MQAGLLERPRERPRRAVQAVSVLAALVLLGVTCAELATHVARPAAPAAVPPVDGLAAEPTTQCLANPHPVVPLIGAECQAKSHYCRVGNGTLHWEPLNHCVLPPPQPFWLAALLTGTKSILMALVFWTSVHGGANIWMDYMGFGFVFVNSVVCPFLLAFKAAFMAGFDSLWEHFQCFGLIMSSAPFGANFFLYFLKVEAAAKLGKLAHQKNDSAFRKWLCYTGTAVWFLVCIIFLDGVFLVTNILPMLLCSLPIIIVGFVPGYVWFWGVVVPASDYADSTGERSINLRPVVAGFLVGTFFDLALQWLAASSVYLYHGMGYTQSMWMASSERQSSIYFESLADQVLSKWAWGTELAAQLLP